MKLHELKIRIIFGLLLVALISLTWILVHGKSSVNSWFIPYGYGGDSYFGLATAKSYYDGEFNLLGSKFNKYLNAPYGANWNDWAVTEDTLFYLIGKIGAFCNNIFLASNLIMLGLSVLSGLSFFIVLLNLNCNLLISFPIAFSFSFSNFYFARGFGHIVLASYWHVPIFMLITWQLFLVDTVNRTVKYRLFIYIIAAIVGSLNPYYTYIYIQFIIFAIVVNVIRSQYRLAMLSFSVFAITSATFLLFNLDTILHSIQYGKNNLAVTRNLAGLEIYGLKFPELFLNGGHRYIPFREFSNVNYFSQTLIKGEIGSSYIGFLGIVGFVLLVCVSLYFLIKRRYDEVPTSFWQLIWILLYSTTGGVNLLLGVLGVQIFRATNRYSIVILSIALVFLAGFLTKITKKRPGISFVLFITLILIVIFDQIPFVKTPTALYAESIKFSQDQKFFTKFQAAVPPKSHIFQLPIQPFPESPGVGSLDSYDNFRAYLFTNELYYSFGGIKGRSDADWQFSLVNKTPTEFLFLLRNNGFEYLYLNLDAKDEFTHRIYLYAQDNNCKMLISEFNIALYNISKCGMKI